VEAPVTHPSRGEAFIATRIPPTWKADLLRVAQAKRAQRCRRAPSPRQAPPRRRKDDQIVNMDVYRASQRARAKTVRARADAALSRLGGKPVDRSSNPLTRGLTASEMEKDAASIRNILRVWKITGKGGPGSTIVLPSGREIKAPGSNDTRSQFEWAVKRTPKHLRPQRRKQG
jgi:hypothetical protein